MTDADLLALHQRFPKLAMVNRRLPRLNPNCFSVDHVAAGRLLAQRARFTGLFCCNGVGTVHVDCVNALQPPDRSAEVQDTRTAPFEAHRH